jgi:hypothetical protein
VRIRLVKLSTGQGVNIDRGHTAYIQNHPDYCPQTNLRSNFFKVYENGTRLFNAHRILNVTAYALSIIAMIIILTTKNFK